MAAEEQKPAPRRSLPRRIARIVLRVLLWTLASILGLLGIAWVLLLILFPDDRIRRLMIQQIEQQTGLPVEAGELELHILRGLSLRDVALRAPKGFSERPVSIERIDVEYSLGQLLDRQFVVKRIHLVRPRLVFEEREGVTNIQALLALRKPPANTPPAPEPDAAGASFRVDLESLHIDGLEVVVALGAARLHLTDGEIRLMGSLRDGAFSAQAEVSLPCPEKANLVLEGLPSEIPGGRLSLSAGLNLEVGLSAEGALRAEGALDLCQPVFPHGAPLRLHVGAAMSDGGRRVELSRFRLDSLARGAPRALLELSGELAESEEGLRYSVRAGRILLSELAREAIKKSLSRGDVTLEEAEARGLLGGGLPEARVTLALSDVGLSGDGLAQGMTGTLEGVLKPSPAGGRLSVNGKIEGIRAGNAAIMLERPRVEFSLASGLVFGAERGGLVLQPEPLSLRFSAAQATGPLVASNVSGSLELASAGGAVTVAGGRVALPRLAAALSTKAGRVVLPQGELLSPFVNAKLAFPAGPLDASNLSELASGRLQCGASLVKLAQASAQNASFTADLSGGGIAGARLRRPLQARLEARLGEASVAGGANGAARVEGVALAARIEAPVFTPLAVSGDFSAEIAALDLSLPDGRWAPGRLRLEARGGLAKERATLEAFRLDVPAHFSATGSGAADLPAGDLKAKAHLDPVRIETLLAALPPAWTAGLPAMRGELEIDSAVSGTFANLMSPAAGELPAARVEIWLRGVEAMLARPEVEISGMSGRIQAQTRPSAGTQQAGVNLTVESVRAPGLELSGLSLALSGTGTGPEDVGLKGSLRALRAELAALAPMKFSPVTVDLDARLLGKKEIWIREISVAIPNLASRWTGEGQLVWPGSWDRLADIRTAGKLRYRFDSAEPVRFGPHLSARGKASLDAGIESRAGGVAELEGQLSFENADLEAGTLSISGMSGALPVRQRLSFFPALELLASSGSPSPDDNGGPSGPSRAYEEALRPLRGEQRRFSIDRVKVGEWAFSRVSGGLAVDEGRLTLDRLAFSFLGGDVLARMQIAFAPAARRSFSLDGEMSGVDLSKLGGLGAGASEVAGTVRLNANLYNREIGAAFHLTQIGSSTLDAMLQALDPAHANPGIARLRKFLDRFKVAPRSALVELSLGRLDMEVRFDMGIAARAASGLIDGFAGDTYRLPPLPVGGLVEGLLRF